MALIACPKCGKKVSDMATSCPECGFPVSDVIKKKVKRCPECGTEVPNDAGACFECGYPFQNIEESSGYDTSNVNSRKTSSESHFRPEYSTMDNSREKSYNSVIDRIITAIKIVSIIWIVVGVFQLGVTIYIGQLYDKWTGDVPNRIVFLGCVAIVNIVGGIKNLYRESDFRENPLRIYDTFELTVADVIEYIWNLVWCCWLFSERGLYGFLGLIVLAAVLTDILGVKVKIGNNKSMFIILKQEAREKEEEEFELSANDDELPGDYWPCPKCEGPIKRFPCKYCGYIVIEREEDDLY